MGLIKYSKLSINPQALKFKKKKYIKIRVDRNINLKLHILKVKIKLINYYRIRVNY